MLRNFMNLSKVKEISDLKNHHAHCTKYTKTVHFLQDILVYTAHISLHENRTYTANISFKASAL